MRPHEGRYLLCSGAPRTVDDVAQELELTSNAVRADTTNLERDGLVEQQGSRRTAHACKPSYTS
ncbi:MAG: hypothetical protein M3014_03335 [Chloroflexota bacterium]|nr:hypothetical protein [Chloroflexota bacterium]